MPDWNGSLLTGQRGAAGLEYRRNRYYDPQQGRFTQENPIGLAGGMNLYGFANGDPVNFSDPFGLSPLPCCIEGGIMIAAALNNPMVRAKERIDRITEWTLGWTGAGLTVQENRAVGLAAEGLLRRIFGGKTTGLQTSLGMRYVDALADGVARESKAGKTYLTSRARSQIAKDVELVNTPGSGVTSVEWHFYPGITGTGPSRALRGAFE